MNFSTGEMEYDLEFDYASLLDEAKNEETTLITNLREDLKALDISELITKQQNMVENALKMASKGGRIWKIM